MHHGPEFTVVLIAGVALLAGAAMRLFSARTRLPYTVGMLVLGIATGIALRRLPGVAEGHGALSLIGKGASITPDLIIFVFLPALVFESAYAIDVRAFRRNLGAVTLLAVPALVVSTVLVAALMVSVTGSSWVWGWSEALVFGALISATDPVAVVAILRELGVSKRLAILIEGESLLNDGTSIVVFSILVGLLTGEVASFSLGDALVRFVLVVAGGIAVGLFLATILSKWIELLFNDPLSEITLTLILAYSAMVAAEGFLHVSGVMAVVVAGLWMSGRGKTKVSPEVSHFLHRFLGMLGYIANTLIFFLVGLVIAEQVDTAGLGDMLLVLVAYVGVMVIRFALTYAFQPLNDRWSEGVSSKDSAVISWGGLRGAVSLALALIVAQNQDIEPSVRGQILLVTAGVVLLTIFVNGSTISRLLRFLGFDVPPLAERLATLTARTHVLDEVREHVEAVRQSRDLRAVAWDDVTSEIDRRRDVIGREIESARDELRAAPEKERVAAVWRQVLAVERQAYWEAYAEGTLGTVAVQLLTSEIDRQLDHIDRGDLDPPASRAPKLGRGLLGMLAKRRVGFEQLALIYDLSRAETLAATRVLDSLDARVGAAPEMLGPIRSCYRGYLVRSKERIEEMRSSLPEIVGAIETRLVNRIVLNFEREGYESLVEHGILDHEAAQAELDGVERRMSLLKRSATRAEIPETADLVAKSPMFESCDAEALRELAEITEEMVLPAGEFLFHENDKGDALYVVARGALHIVKEIGGESVIVDVLGGGDILGEIALLTGARRTAAARGATDVMLGRIRREAFQSLIDAHPDLRASVWDAFSRRSFDNHVREHPAFRHLDRAARLAWHAAGRVVDLAAGAHVEVGAGERHVFLLTGRVLANGAEQGAVALLPRGAALRIDAIDDSRVVLLPEPSQL